MDTSDSEHGEVDEDPGPTPSKEKYVGQPATGVNLPGTGGGEGIHILVYLARQPNSRQR